MEEERGGGEQKGILLLEAQCSFKGDCCVRPLYSFYSSQRESRLPVPVPVDAGADGDSHRNDDSGSLTCHEELENVRVINAILKDRPGATIFPHHDFNYPRYLPRLFPAGRPGKGKWWHGWWIELPVKIHLLGNRSSHADVLDRRSGMLAAG